MIAAELLRTAFQGVIIFLIFGSGCGIAAALLYLKFGSRLPGENDRRRRMMTLEAGIDPISGEAPDQRRPRRTAVSIPVKLR